MSKTRSEPWFPREDTPVFRGDEPLFFDTTQLPWVAGLESQWTVIRDELVALMHEHQTDFVPYADHAMATTPRRWKSFLLMYWTLAARANCAKCPRTMDILKRIPHLTSCGFSLLEPGTTIKPHQGDTNAVYRCHLPLIVPAGAPQCAFRVGHETRSWEEGRLLVFCDAYTHTAWNNTDQVRGVLLFDVMRPEYASRTTSICSRVLAKIYLQIAYQRQAWLRRYLGGRRPRAAMDRLLYGLLEVVLRCRIPMPPLLESL